MKRLILWTCLILLIAWSVPFARAIEIQSEFTNLYVTEDNLELAKNRTLTIRCTQNDRYGQLFVQGHNITVECSPPIYVYNKRLAGWIPKETQTTATSMCVISNPFGEGKVNPNVPQNTVLKMFPELRKPVKEGKIRLQGLFGSVGCALDSIFGGGCGGSGVSREEFDIQVDRIDSLMDWRNRTITWMEMADVVDAKQNAAIELANDINKRQDVALASVQSQATQIAEMMDVTGKYVDTQLANLQADTRTLALQIEQTAQDILEQSQSGDLLLLNQMNSQDRILAAAIQNHSNVTRENFGRVNEQSRYLARNVRDLLATVYDMFSNRAFRREQTRLVWNAIEELRSMGLEPFLDKRAGFAGKPPMELTDNQELPISIRTVFVDNVWLNYITQASSGSSQIVSHKIVLECNTRWALNYARTWNEYQDVMERIGPASCNPSQPQGSRCVCWIKVQTSQCSRAVSSWNWSSTTNANIDQTVCASNSYSRGNEQYIFKLDQWHSWLQNKCIVPIAGEYTIFSERMNTISRVPYDLKVCPMEVDTFLYNPPNYPTMPFAIYQLWKDSFRVMVLQLPDIEKEVYGWLPRGLTGIRSPLSYLENGTSAICDVQLFQGVSPTPLRVTELSLTDIDTSVSVSSPSLPGEIVTEKILSVPFDSVLPPSTMALLGSLTAGSTSVYDLPFLMSQLNGGRAGVGGIKDQPTYFLFPANIPTVTSYEKWTDIYSDVEYDPRDAMVGAQSFVRERDGSTGECSTEVDTGTFGFWCTLLEHFVVHPQSNNDRLVLQPNEWSYVTTINVPEGTIMQLRTAECPSISYRVSATRSVELTITNPLDSQPNTLRLHVSDPSCSEQDEVISITLRPKETMTHRIPPPCSSDEMSISVLVERIGSQGEWVACNQQSNQPSLDITVPAEDSETMRLVTPTAADVVYLSEVVQSDISLRFTSVGVELTKMIVHLLDFVRPDNTYALLLQNGTNQNDTLAALQAMYQSTRNNLTESVHALLTGGLKTNLTSNGTLSNLIQPYLQQIQEDSKVVADVLANNSKSLIEMDDIIAQLDNLTETRANYTEELRRIMEEEDKKFADMMDSVDASGSCKPGLNPLTWIASAGCGVGKVTSSVLGSLTGGLGGIGDFFLGPLKTIFTLAMYVLVIYGLFLLVRFLYHHWKNRKPRNYEPVVEEDIGEARESVEMAPVDSTRRSSRSLYSV